MNLKYLERAFELALKAKGHTSPNPLVGAVLVRNDQIIAEGYHKEAGSFHAEAEAFNAANGIDLEGADLYCTLEPCCHTDKKTPPCAQEIIKRKIKNVYISALDPNPKVNGKGIKLLQEAGIHVEHGFMLEKADELNKVFNKVMSTGLPYIHLKIAQSLDGTMSLNSGESKWITDEDARKQVHELRGFYDGVLIGAQTARNDRPSLTIRYGLENDFPQPRPIILGSKNGIHEELKKRAVFINSLKDLNELVSKHSIHSILVEGGPKTLSSFIEKGLYDELSFFIAPKIIGKGKHSFEQFEITSMKDHKSLKLKSVNIINDQIRADYLKTK